jgi:hypothetical protein
MARLREALMGKARSEMYRAKRFTFGVAAYGFAEANLHAPVIPAFGRRPVLTPLHPPRVGRGSAVFRRHDLAFRAAPNGRSKARFDPDNGDEVKGENGVT